MKSSQKGFTLVEILIVLAIIGILASVALVGLGPIQRRGRDARRVQDLKQIQTALELYFSKNGSYPPSTGNYANDFSQANLAAWNIGVTKLPDDPLTSQHYMYGVAAGGGGYTLAAILEDQSNAVLKDKITGISNGVNCGAANTTEYCVTL